ncbi:MAG: hypothetical protein CVU71_04355 [Deltaproteobacteria bacterium HGW-Deltaproteobacteria-6]|jgi:hypothetical protein|nr:MAG: hypothetical protein CVU71_04355 [Deltaproteobacteria bacterium HGW-Deltaproteobacteria-6]
MGRPLNLSGTQAKEKARQQKQAGKELKRRMTRQKKIHAGMPVSKAHPDTAEPILTGSTAQSAD